MADDDGQPGVPANQSPGSLFTQEQVNHFQADAKRGAVGGFFKELGFDKPPTADELKAALADAGEFKKLKDGEKNEVDRLTGELAAANEKAAKASELEIITNRQRIAADLQLPTRVWKFVEGKTDDEIKESIKGLRTDLGLPEQSEGASGQQQGGPRPPKPVPGQGSGGGGKPKATLTTGRDLYASKHPPTKERAAE